MCRPARRRQARSRPNDTAQQEETFDEVPGQDIEITQTFLALATASILVPS